MDPDGIPWIMYVELSFKTDNVIYIGGYTVNLTLGTGYLVYLVPAVWNTPFQIPGPATVTTHTPCSLLLDRGEWRNQRSYCTHNT